MSDEPYYPEDTRAKNECFGCEEKQKKLTEAQGTISHLRDKAEFNMPIQMRGRFHNGQCPDPCDMIDGPCACGAYHNVKEWLGKLNSKLNTAIEMVASKNLIIEQLNRTLNAYKCSIQNRKG